MKTTIPKRHSPEDRLRLRVISFLALGASPPSAVIALLSLLSDDRAAEGLAFGLSAVVGFVALGLCKMGLVRLASLLVPLGLLCIVFPIAVAGHGIHDISIAALPLVLLAAGLLQGARAPLYWWLVCVVALGGVYSSEMSGFTTTIMTAETDVSDVFYLSAILLTIAGVLSLTLRNLEASLERRRQQEEELAESVSLLAREKTATRESEAHWRALVLSSPMRISSLDARGVVQFTNDSEGADDVLGRSFLEFVAESDRESARRALERVFDSGESEIIEIAAATGERWFTTHVGAVLREGLAVGYTLASSDITEVHRARVEREELIQRLEQQNSELERFTYTISHDLKSPLITISSFLDLVEDDLAAGKEQRVKLDIARIRTATQKMHDLLRDLLELSRVGRLEEASETFPASRAIGDSLATLDQRKLAKVELEVGDDLPMLYADPRRIKEVFQNLIGNALKFLGDQTAPEIEVGGRESEQGWVFFVRDNGVGIDPRYHEKVFGLFERLSVEPDGTGVGLTLVKRIVQLYGGSIWIESGGSATGTTVSFTIPRAVISTEASLESSSVH